MTQLNEQEFEKKGALWPFLKRIFKYSMKHKRWFWGFVAAVGFVAIADATFPIIWMHLIDNEIVPQVEALAAANAAGETYVVSYNGLIKYALMFFGLGMAHIIGVFLFIRFAGYIQEHVMYQLREEMFGKLQHLSFSFYDRSASGWLLSRITSDSNRVSEVISWGFLDAIWGITMIFACFTAMFYYNWLLALVVLVTIPFLVLVSYRLRMLILKYSRLSRKQNSELTAAYTENINGVEVNKSTAQENKAAERFSEVSSRMQQSSYKASYFTAVYLPLVIMIGSIAAALVIYLGGRMAIAVPAGITVGVLAAFFGYATRIFEPIMDITRFYALAQGSLSAGERIFSLIDEEVEIKDKKGVQPFNRIKGDITFEKVSFEYVEGKPVLHALDLHIPAGQSVALVGESGGGKSTIVSLISRFYEPTTGSLKIDGIDYRDRTLHSLRSQMGVVLQTPHLHSGTIRENISYGKMYSDEQIIAALTAVGAEQFIPMLNDECGEGGNKLSLGEKQLISFARAVLTEPSIFIMDEATSSIDTITEQKIQIGIEKLIKGRTSIIIAHRLSTIRNCDRILLINRGQIVEEGNHYELMAQKGQYYKLYMNQLRQEKQVVEIGEVPIATQVKQ